MFDGGPLVVQGLAAFDGILGCVASTLDLCASAARQLLSCCNLKKGWRLHGDLAEGDHTHEKYEHALERSLQCELG